MIPADAEQSHAPNDKDSETGIQRNFWFALNEKRPLFFFAGLWTLGMEFARSRKIRAFERSVVPIAQRRAGPRSPEPETAQEQRPLSRNF